MNTFDDLNLPDYLRFDLLIRRLEGEAKNLVKDYRNYPGNLFRSAMEMLDDKYLMFNNYQIIHQKLYKIGDTEKMESQRKICVGIRHLDQVEKDNFIGFIYCWNFSLELKEKYKYVKISANGEQVEAMLKFLSM